MPSGEQEDAVDDLLRRLALQAGAVVRAVLHADAGVQQAQVVVDLGDGADGGARVAAGALLIDGDGRRETLDDVDVGLVHLAEELAGVRRERLDVATLALGVDGVEREAALARTGQAGEHDEPVAGDLDVDVLQVVLAGAADDDLRFGSRGHAGEATKRTDVPLDSLRSSLPRAADELLHDERVGATTRTSRRTSARRARTPVRHLWPAHMGADAHQRRASARRSRSWTRAARSASTRPSPRTSARAPAAGWWSP